MTIEKLIALIQAGKVDAVLDLIEKTPAKERAALLPGVRAARTETRAGTPQRKAAEAAVFALGTLEDAMSLGWADQEWQVAVAQRFKPPFASRLAEAHLERAQDIGLVQALVVGGVCPRPSNDAYIVALMAAQDAIWWQDGKVLRSYDVEILEHMLAQDPALVTEGIIWRVFEVEGTGEHNLASMEKYRGPAWSDLFVRLSQDGRASRDRLLDRTLETLGRDWPQFRSGWFSRFHDRLAPTVAERAARCDRYLGLLSSRIPPTAALALASLEILWKAGQVDAGKLVNGLRPLASAAAKGMVLKVLALAEQAASREPKILPAVRQLVAGAVKHADAAVQKKALALAARLGAGTVLAGAEALVAPSNRAALGQLTGAVAKARSTPKKRAAAPRLSPLDPSRRIVPIATCDELVQQIAHVLENDDPDELERVLDGLARLSGELVAAPKILAALVKRARRVNEPPQTEVARWLQRLAGVEVVPVDWESPVIRFLQARTDELIARTVAITPLSTPTHAGGFIDPEVLAARLTAWPKAQPPSVCDVQAARLRVGPLAPKALLARLDRLGGREPFLATPTWRVERRDSDGWVFHDFFVEVKPRPPAGKAPADFTRRLWDKGRFSGQIEGASSLPRMAFSLWPWASETWCAIGASAIANNLDWSEASWSDAAFLEKLLDPLTTFGPWAQRLLALGLASKETGHATLSVDALVAAFQSGRLEPASFGKNCAALMATGIIKAARWSKTFAQAAGADDQVAAAVVESLQHTFTGDAARAPRDLGKLLACLAELSVDHPVPLPAATRSYLEALPGGGEVARGKKALL
jgi:hypothetical protein